MSTEVRKVDISTATFLKIIILFVLIAFLYIIKEIIVLIFLALILASAIGPWVRWLTNKKIPKALSILIIYILFVGVIATVITLVIPPVATEISQLAQLFPEYYQKIAGFFSRLDVSESANMAQDIQFSLSSLSTHLNQAIGSIFSATAQVFSALAFFVSMLVIAFYFTMEENAIKKLADSIVPKKYHSYIFDLISRIQEKLGQWFRGQLILSLIIFGITFLGLLILSIFFNIKYIVILALLAGVFEIIPYFGPWIAGAAAVALTLTQAPFIAVVFVIVLYLLIQQLENTIIVPRVIGKSVGLNPLVVIIAILVGFKLGGMLGGLIAVPIAAALSVFVGDFLNKRKV